MRRPAESMGVRVEVVPHPDPLTIALRIRPTLRMRLSLRGLGAAAWLTATVLRLALLAVPAGVRRELSFIVTVGPRGT